MTSAAPATKPQHDPEALFRAYLNDREVTGRTALFMAVEVNRPKCVETLLAFRANPNIPNHQGITPLQVACEKGYQTCIRVLVRNHASCAVEKGKGLIDLIWQSVVNLDERAELLAYLIANGAQCDSASLNAQIENLGPENQPTFRKAIAEAQLLRQKTLSAPHPESIPADVLNSHVGFNQEIKKEAQ